MSNYITLFYMDVITYLWCILGAGLANIWALIQYKDAILPV